MTEENMKKSNDKIEVVGVALHIQKAVIVTIFSLAFLKILKSTDLLKRTTIVNNYYVINDRVIPVRFR